MPRIVTASLSRERPMLGRLAVTAVSTSALLTACMFEPTLCSYEARSVRLSGELVSPDYSEPAAAVLRLHETRDGALARELAVSVETYYPGDLAVVLDSSSAGVDTVITLPLGTQARTNRGGSVRLGKRDRPLFHYLHAAALEGRLRLEVHQSELPWEPMRGRLAVLSSQGWERPTCAGT